MEKVSIEICEPSHGSLCQSCLHLFTLKTVTYEWHFKNVSHFKFYITCQDLAFIYKTTYTCMNIRAIHLEQPVSICSDE